EEQWCQGERVDLYLRAGNERSPGGSLPLVSFSANDVVRTEEQEAACRHSTHGRTPAVHTELCHRVVPRHPSPPRRPSIFSRCFSVRPPQTPVALTASAKSRHGSRTGHDWGDRGRYSSGKCMGGGAAEEPRRPARARR